MSIDRTLGIIGLGRIGQAMARSARGFDMKILYNDRKRLDPQERLGVHYPSLTDLLRESDFVSLHVSLTSETRHMISERELKL